MTEPDALDNARTALEKGDWQVVLDLLNAEGDVPEREALELRAQAAYGLGMLEAAVEAWEDLHTLCVAAGDTVDAARAAATIAMYLMMDTGLMAPVRGWLRRAERLLEDHEEKPAHAIIAMVRTYERFMCGDMDAAREQSAVAIELGTRLSVMPAVVIGRVASARVEIYDGNVEEGLGLLEEVGALLMSGEVDSLTTGMMYCELICAAQGLALFDMASEWTDVMERWRPGAAFGGINGRCRVHRAEILRVTGPCDLAEEEALGACDELRPWMRREFGWPLVELGNIRLRKGDLAGAEEAFLAAHEHAWSPQPGLALLRLAQGDVETALALITDAIAHPFDTPSKERPPYGDLRLAPLFDAQAEIAAASGDVELVRAAADALSRTASRYQGRPLAASADLATARLHLLLDEVADAIRAAGRAATRWAEIGAPFETAAARVVLGQAYAAGGNPGRARMEWEAAHSAFGSYGASREAERSAAHLAALDGGPDAGLRVPSSENPAPAALATFRRDGDTRTVCFDGREALVRDLKGFRYIERMLAEPGREFHVLDLVAVEQGALPVGSEAFVESSDLELDTGAGLPAIDEQAREAYRRRLAEVDDDIEEAERTNDTGRLEMAQRDRDYLIAELSRAVGLGGRHRTIGSTAEKGRTSVTRAIRYSLERLGQHHPLVAAHLANAVHTGTYCSYQLDPLTPLRWEVSGDGPA